MRQIEYGERFELGCISFEDEGTRGQFRKTLRLHKEIVAFETRISFFSDRCRVVQLERSWCTVQPYVCFLCHRHQDRNDVSEKNGEGLTAKWRQKCLLTRMTWDTHVSETVGDSIFQSQHVGSIPEVEWKSKSKRKQIGKRRSWKIPMTAGGTLVQTWVTCTNGKVKVSSIF